MSQELSLRSFTMHVLASGLLLSSMAAGERLLHGAFSTLPSQPPASPAAEASPQKMPACELVDRAVKKNVHERGFDIDLEYPILVTASSHMSPPRGLNTVNKQIAEFVMEQKQEFLNSESYAEGNPPFFSCDYQVALLTPSIVSIRLCFGVPGGAHPNSYLKTLTYDLQSGRKLSLEEFFGRKVPYKFLSGYCADALKDQLGVCADEPTIETGTDPDPSNYSNYLVTDDGLEICFDAYQVASYAEGQQSVTIPYKVLEPFMKDSPVIAAGLLQSAE